MKLFFVRKQSVLYGRNSGGYVLFGAVEWCVFCGYSFPALVFFLSLLTVVVVTAAWQENNLSPASVCWWDLVLLHIKESTVSAKSVCSIAK